MGVWSDGETVWIAEWLGDTVHGYRLSDGERAPARDIRLAAGNLLPVGLWSDGGDAVGGRLGRADGCLPVVGRRAGAEARRGGEGAPTPILRVCGLTARRCWRPLGRAARSAPTRCRPPPGLAVAAARAGEPWRPCRRRAGDPALRAAIRGGVGRAGGRRGACRAGSAGRAPRRDPVPGRAGGRGQPEGTRPRVQPAGRRAKRSRKLPSLRSLNLDGAAPDLSALCVTDRPRTVVAAVTTASPT